MAEVESAPAQQQSVPRIKIRFGTVVSDKMQKTVVVAVETTKRHRLYKKTLRRTKRYKAHDEHNECHLGDQVRIVETRPLSKEKRWRVAEILVRGNVADVQPSAIGREILEPTAADAESTEDNEA
jgi:small subunit ribosomal protein S17